MGSLRTLRGYKEVRGGIVVAKRCLSSQCRHSLVFMKKYAFLDSVGEDEYEIWLHWLCEECKTVEDIRWPESWQNWVNVEFLETQGFEIVT